MNNQDTYFICFPNWETGIHQQIYTEEKWISCIPVGLCKFFWTNILLRVPSIDDSSMWERSPITVQYIILKVLNIKHKLDAYTEPQNTSWILNYYGAFSLHERWDITDPDLHTHKVSREVKQVTWKKLDICRYNFTSFTLLCIFVWITEIE